MNIMKEQEAKVLAKFLTNDEIIKVLKRVNEKKQEIPDTLRKSLCKELGGRIAKGNFWW